MSMLNSGVLKEVLVKPGDLVKAGQVLATLDPTVSGADLEQLAQKLASDEAEVARRKAEVSDKAYVSSGTGPYDQLQRSIYEQRQAEYRASLSDFDDRIRSTDATRAQYARDAVEYRKRLKLAEQLEQTYQPLLKSGYVSKLQWVTAVDTRVEIGRLLADSENQLESQQQLLSSLRSQRAAYIQKWHGDTGQALVLVQNDLDVTKQGLEKAQNTRELESLRAPADSVVLKIGKVSVGSVAGSPAGTAPEPLFTLMPANAPLEAEVKIAAADAGFIKVGDPLQVKLDAYRFTEHGTAKGVVKNISEGSFTTDENNQPVDPYFKVRVAITDVHLRNVPADFQLTPGMTLQGDIMVGRRTILAYLIGGALRTGSEAMREP